ncbi:hypothetical protein [Mangrovivirga cuniculi]|uniref:Uncharacterized protein n=1 Tax=Mangrovivirga cuniculi TaxID=2715131 RepID=A0A4D7JZV7_9BACT|nr:hypothetical protein [Mangrovivirga cuniculi]QCK14194.1 hypothetical protein DCC35_05265 [Mangrovivirga cuniculi]
MKIGFHKLSISSKAADLKVEEEIFILVNQHIVIEYFPKESLDYKNRFFIRNRIFPFHPD